MGNTACRVTALNASYPRDHPLNSHCQSQSLQGRGRKGKKENQGRMINGQWKFERLKVKSKRKKSKTKSSQQPTKPEGNEKQ